MKLILFIQIKIKYQESDDDLKGEDLNRLDENFDYSQSEMNYVNSNQGNNNDNSGGNSNKKPRGSRYRGVSRNGNQWQVKSSI